MISYHVPRTRQHSRAREVVAGIVVVGLLVGAGLTRSYWQPHLTEWLRPALGKLTSLSSGLGGVANKVDTIQNLSTRVQQLEQENRELQQKIVAMEGIRQENSRLQQLLSLPLPENYRPIGARVISRSPDHWFERVYIDVGSEQGVAPNQVVLNTAGVVGRVREVTAQTALVQLLSDPDSSVACLTEFGRSPAVLQGLHRESGQLKYLQNYAQVKPGEQILTSGLGGIFPPGLVVGTVEQVEKATNHPVPEVQVKLTALQQTVEEVLVLLPDGSRPQVEIPERQE